MKKKCLLIIIALALFVTSIGLAACDGDDGGKTDSTTYTVTFVSNGGSAVDAMTVQEGGKITKPADPTKANHTFEGWYKERELVTQWNFATDSVTANITLYAKWKENGSIEPEPVERFTVTFMDGNSVMDEVSVQKGNVVFLPDLEKYGYIFAGWYDSAEFNGSRLNSPYTPTGNVTLWIKWVPDDKYTVTFVSNGGSAVDEVTVQEGGKITKPSDPTRANHTFEGWYKERELVTQWNFATDSVTANITLYAKWKENGSVEPEPVEKFIVTFMNGSEVFDTQQVESGSTATAPLNTPAKASTAQIEYTFAGWCADANLTEDYDLANTAVTENITLYAKFIESVRQYTVTFLVDGNTYGQNQEVEYGGKVKKPTDPVKESSAQFDYEFIGWFENTDDSAAFDFESSITANVTLYARFAETRILLNYALNSDGKSYSITGVRDKTATEIIIPEYYREKPVTRIGYAAFYGCSTLTSIMLPEGVTSIGNYAFEGCSSLTSITLPEGVTSIGNDAFRDCSSLTSVIWNATECKTAGGSSYPIFSGCTSLTEVTFGNNVKMLPDYAFSGCSTLTNITIGSGVTSIGNYAFRYCRLLTGITISESVTSIGSSAFAGCYKLVEVYNLSPLNITKGSSANGYVGYYAENIYTSSENVSKVTVTADGYIFFDNGVYQLLGYTGSDAELILPDRFNGNNYAVYKYAFYGCNSLTGITIPESVTNIGEYAFYNCSSLTGITLPKSVTNIGDFTFSGCSSLTGITLPESVTSIGESAFRFCSSLTGITLPEGVTGIGTWAFSGCSSLTRVIWNATECKTAGSNSYPIFSGCASLTEVTFGNNVKVIPAYAFSRCISLTSITLPEGVTSIGERAFEDCSSLTSVIWNATDCKMAGRSSNPIFSGCTSLTEVTFGNNVKVIPAYAFSHCSSLTSITIPNSVTSIGSWSFSGCSSLTSVILPESMTSIVDWMFSYCSSLTSITLPEGVTSIGFASFSGCSSLTSIMLPENVTSIGERAFEDCSSLTSIMLPEGLTSIGSSAFRDCSSLTSAIWNATECKTAGSNNYSIFSGCTSLTSVTFGNNAKIIPASAFRDCSSLTNITIGSGVTSIGDWALYGCSSLESITVKSGNTRYHSAGNCLIETETKALVLGCKNSIIPNDGSVTSIGNSAFWGCSSLTGITIPNSVTAIGSSAFRDCSSLTGITIPEGVTSIGELAFQYCSSLTSVIWNATDCKTAGSSFSPIFAGCTSLTEVTFGNNVKTISASAFANCRLLTSITLPEGVTSIGSSAFEGCRLLTSITLPENVTSIGGRAFRDCSSLTSIMLPEGVTSIGSSAFEGCSSLTSITIPNSVTSIGSWSFRGCSSLTSVIWNATECKTAGNSTYPIFSGCTSLTEVTFGNNVKIIPDYAFYGCSSITGVALPEGVTSIGYSAFYGCSSLTSITLPESVTSISEYAFRDCSSLMIVIWNATECTKSGGYSIPIFSGCTSLTEVIFGNNVKKIPDSAFYNCSSLTNITIGSGVTSIGSFAFYGCSSLESITVKSGNTRYHSAGNCLIETETKALVLGCKNSIIPNDGSVTSIGSSAFEGCSLLSSITIPEGVTSIDINAFEGCSSLSSITVKSGNTRYHSAGNCLIETKTKVLVLGCKNSIIPNDGSVTRIGSSAFRGCSSLSSITIPEGVTSIGRDAFRDCSSLTSVTIPNSVTSIGDYAFYGCSSLTGITIGGGVTSIGRNAFRDCISLTSVIWNAAECQTAGDSSYPIFSGCTSLTEVTFGNNVRTIPDYAFYGCSSITSIALPEGVASIGSWSFWGCSSLTSITIPNSVTSIGVRVFYNCSALTDINYNGTMTQWQDISKESGWDENTGNYTITCTGGTLDKQGVNI